MRSIWEFLLTIVTNFIKSLYDEDKISPFRYIVLLVGGGLALLFLVTHGIIKF